MRYVFAGFVLAGLLCALPLSPAGAQAEPGTQPGTPVDRIITIKPQYLSPAAILRLLGIPVESNTGAWEWVRNDNYHIVNFHLNEAANVLIVSGDAADIEYVEKLIAEADLPPRQIEIEVKIVEIRTSEAQDLGIDWENMLHSSHPRATWGYRAVTNDQSDQQQSYDGIYGRQYRDDLDRQKKDIVNRDLNLTASLDLSSALDLLDQSGAGTIHSAPRILTLNNRRATILDGQRVTYITRYSSYTNLFETDSMDAGLHLSVLPSLGESGYITLRVTAELTSLGYGDISGSPIKSGQMIENTIIAKDGETVLLGGLSRTEEYRSTKRFPLLGYVLPFLFSREITGQEEIKSFIILTPRVVDFAVALDEPTRNAIENK